MRTIFAIAVVFALLLAGCDDGPAGDLTDPTDPADQTGHIDPANPAVTWPAGLTAVSGQTLGDISLAAFANDGGTPGAFSWTTPAASVGHDYGASTYSMTFTPTDRSAYHTVTDDVDVSVSIAMVLVQKGSFMMGQNGDGTVGNNVTPIKTVTLTQDFYMGKYEVTQAQWEAVMETTIQDMQLVAYPTDSTNYGRGDAYPMYCVNWYEALAFCNKLSVMEGFSPAYSIEINGEDKTNPDEWGEVPTSYSHENYAQYQAVKRVTDSTGYQLPSEAQWEYAVKGGHKASDPPYIYPGSNRIGLVAWYSFNNGTSGTELYGAKRVGTKQANELGIHDMMGNAREWCLDSYASSRPAETDDPLLWGGANSNKNTRGDYWNGSSFPVNSSAYYPYLRHFMIGFRLVRPAVTQ